MDACKKPVTVKKHGGSLLRVLHHDGLLAGITSASETATNTALCALSFDTSSKSESRTLTVVSGVFQQPR